MEKTPELGNEPFNTSESEIQKAWDFPMYRIVGWETIYENSRSRELRRLDFVLVPNHHDTDGYRTLISRPRGTALFGAWILILQVASKCTPRGVLMRSPSCPHTPETIARMTGGDARVISEAFTVLASPEVGWIEASSASHVNMNIPPRHFANSETKARANGRVDRFLKSGKGVVTPTGDVTERPVTCQWCGLSPAPDAHGVTNIRAHHFLPYGTYDNDRVVIFVCRSCHGYFESGKYTNQMIFDRFGDYFVPRATAGPPQVTAGTCGGPADQSQVPAVIREGNGREEKRKKRAGFHPLILSISERIHKRHPPERRGATVTCQKHLATITAKLTTDEQIEQRLSEIDARHAGWCEYWKRDGNKYAKGLENWLAPTMGRYDEDPPALISNEPPPPQRFVV